MWRNILTALVLLCAASASAQVITVDKVTARQTLTVNGRTVNEISTDSTFSAATHLQLPTAKAVKDYIDAVPPGSGVDSISILEDSIIVLYASSLEISRDTLTITGEANTASNLGDGEGVFAQKSGVDLEFKSIDVGSGNLQISSDANKITIQPHYQYFGSDAAAAAGGIEIGEVYKADIGNIYGLPWGTLKTRTE